MAISKEQPLRPYVQALGDSVDSLNDAVDIGDIVSADAVQAFDTVAEMQVAAYLTSGMTCHTNGNVTVGDGGAAWYTVGTSGTITLQNGLYATEIASSSVKHLELVTTTAETNEDAKGSFIFNRDVIEIDTRTGGNRAGHNTGFCTNVNDYGNRQINIGFSQQQAAADFVGNSVMIKDAPYSSVFERSQISAVTSNGITFTTDVSNNINVGNIIWLTQSMERKPSSYPSGTLNYDDVFVYQTYSGYVTEVNGASVNVTGWKELPWTSNTQPTGTTLPVIDTNTKCFVNPLNGIYAHYDLVRIPTGVPNGYKAYHSQTHIYNDCDEAVYCNGDDVTFESGHNGYGFGVFQVSTGRVEAGFFGGSYLDYLIKGSYSHNVPSYRQAIETVGLTSGGVLQKDCQQVDSTTNQGQLKALLTRKDSAKYSAGIYRITTSQTIDVSDLLPNAEYEFIMVGQPTLTINNDSSSKILPVSANTKNDRYDVPAGGSLSIARTTGRGAHNLIRVMYVVPPRLTETGSYPNTTQRDLIITIEAFTLTDYTITTASAG